MLRCSFIVATSVMLASCAGQQGLVGNQPAAEALNFAGILTDAEQCREALDATSSQGDAGFNMAGLQLFNWNTHKNTGADMAADLDRLTEGADLILLQEAVRNSSALADSDPDLHWSFSPGYRTNKGITGVTTASRIKPLAQCTLVHYEPWLKSPKATNITEFSLQGTDETLLVINLHLINFTVGLDAMREQLLQALGFVERHNGPVIVSGDFNTWSKSRRDFVAEVFSARGMTPVGYDNNDQRKRVFGYALDHTFIRNIRVAEGSSYAVSTSDHSPMSVTLEF